MNDTRFHAEDPSTGQLRAPAGEELLPPVEPPSAGFIIQLFVVPALIVLMIVAVWLAFNWLVRTASRPGDVIKGLEDGPAIARWQKASELAQILGDERFSDFKHSSEDASQLARILDREIEAAGMTENDVEFRKYLARALGEFEVQDGIDVLLKAAETNRDPREQRVRDGALQAIAVRAYNLQRLEPPQQIMHPELESTLLELAGDEDPLIRFQTAYALGKIGTPRAVERLEVMVDDPDADTRYNAAVALAHHGNAKAAEILAEMLDLEEHAAAKAQTSDENALKIRGVILHTAIEAALELARRSPSSDLSLVIAELENIAEASRADLAKAALPPRAQFEARRALDVLQADSTKNGAARSRSSGTEN